MPSSYILVSRKFPAASHVGGFYFGSYQGTHALSGGALA